MNPSVLSDTTQIAVTPESSVGAVICTPEWWPSGHRVGVVLAHDVEGSIDQEKLARLQQALSERGNLTLRFNFPYAEAGKKRPDPPHLLERTLRAASATLLRDRENAPARLIIGGYGLGAQVATRVVAQGLKVDGIACLGFPLHPSGKPNQQRAEALFRLICPLLFIQGDRDAHCRVDRLEGLLRRIGAPTQLHVVTDCGQGLELIKRTERIPEEIHAETVEAFDRFIQRVAGSRT